MRPLTCFSASPAIMFHERLCSLEGGLAVLSDVFLLHSLSVKPITAGMGFLWGFTNIGRCCYSDIELPFCFVFVFPSRELVHFMLYVILNHLPESNRIKTFPWKHYLFYSYNTTLVVCACLASAQMVTFQHQLNWCGLTPMFTVPGTSSHFRAAVIHISLAAERRTLDIPHCMTHSCLLKS